MKGRPLRTTRRIGNLQERPGWYRIKMQAAGPALVTIYDEIGFFAVSASNFMADLADLDGDIELHINCPGGDVHDGISIYNQLRQRKGTVGVVVDGLAASAASFIAQAASPGKLAMSPHSQIMIHDGFGMGIGNAQDMREYADLLDKASDNISRIYAERTGKPAEYWRAKMREETWYDDHEAVADGLADYVVGQERPQDKWDLGAAFRRVPGLRAADGQDGGGHAPMTTDGHSHGHDDMGGGSHAHMHAHEGDNNHAPHSAVWDPDGDGDDDTHATTDTDHDHWDERGQPVNRSRSHVRNKDYSADERKALAAKGHAMPDGSYPIADVEDLHNAIHAVGRGGSDHDAIRRHIIKRAAALGASGEIPDNWNADGSTGGSDNSIDHHFWNQVADLLAAERSEQ